MTLQKLLQALGECILLSKNLVILNPEWLWRDVVGWQLSPDQRGRLGFRTTGVYTQEDFQARCPCPAGQALQVLQALNLCIPVRTKIEVKQKLFLSEINFLKCVFLVRAKWTMKKSNMKSQR